MKTKLAAAFIAIALLGATVCFAFAAAETEATEGTEQSVSTSASNGQWYSNKEGVFCEIAY